MNKEISDSLHFLLHCSLNDVRFETQREQFEFIYKYIENLVKENQELKEENERYRKLGFKYLNEQNNKLKEVIEEVKRVLRCNNIEVLKYYDEPSETGSYEIVTVDLLQILDKVKRE